MGGLTTELLLGGLTLRLLRVVLLTIWPGYLSRVKLNPLITCL